jgi:cytochrome c oxidase assembly protein subunit 15
MVRTSLLLVVILVSLSAYLRLAHSGIGCADWPACYGRIGEPPVARQPLDSGDAYRQMGVQQNQAMAWATPVHRLVAGTLGILILLLNIRALRDRKDRVIWVMLLGLTVFLAGLGLRSGNLHSPAVVIGNLAGGFCMLGLLGWMAFRDDPAVQGRKREPLLGRITLVATMLLVFQIFLGGLTSANFGALACRSLPDCHGSWLPGKALSTAFDLSREHQITDQGMAVGGDERAAIHKMHRLGAVLTLLTILSAGLVALSAGRAFRGVATIVLILVALEFSVGIASVLTGLPLALAVAHNWLAALLLLSLLKLLALNRQSGRIADQLHG